MQSKGCEKCGIYGFHACPGSPIKWTPEQEQELNKALAEIFEIEHPEFKMRRFGLIDNE